MLWYTTASIGSFALGAIGLNRGSIFRHLIVALPVPSP
jgi:hypothetical protein